MNIGPIEINAEEIKSEAKNAALEIAHKHIRAAFNDFWPRESPYRKRVFSLVNSTVDELLASPEFKAQISEICRGAFIELAKEKIANAVARTSVNKLRGEK